MATLILNQLAHLAPNTKYYERCDISDFTFFFYNKWMNDLSLYLISDCSKQIHIHLKVNVESTFLSKSDWPHVI